MQRCRRCQEDCESGDEPVIEEIACCLPTLLCLNCVEDWILEFGSRMNEADTAEIMMECFLKHNNPDELLRVANQIAPINHKLNVDTIKWVRAGNTP